ncbi:uncharacterized protein LOC124111879 [Haliotis rufescens]|uniref:uncharacterized protein LOC124111879 n=1 Tax=Haliotis rufescens TaxID=6454 RepID=UPI00201E80AB|nr:uncharacterized protein LOC124111879 [Haliotis rufescens]
MASPQPAGDRWKLSRPDLVCPEPVIARGVSHKPQYNMSKGQDIKTEGKLITCVQEDTVSQNHFESCQDGRIGSAEDVNIIAENNENAALCAENEEILYCQPGEVQPLDSQPQQSDQSDMLPPDSQPRHSDRSDMTPPDSQPRQSDRSDMTPPDSQPRHSDRSDMTPPDSQPRQSDRSDMTPPDSQPRHSDWSDMTPPDSQPRHSDRSDMTPPDSQPRQSDRSDMTPPDSQPQHSDQSDMTPPDSQPRQSDWSDMTPPDSQPRHSDWSDMTPPDSQPRQSDQSDMTPPDSQPRHSDWSDMTPPDSQPRQSDRSDMTPPDSQPRHSDWSDMTPPDSQPRQPNRSDMTPPDSQPRQPNRLETTPPDSQWRQSARQDTTPPDFPSLQPDWPDTTATQTEPDTVTHKKTKPTVLPKHVLEKVEHLVSKKCESDISWIQDVAMHPSNPTLSDAEEECLFGNLFSDQQENFKKRNQASHEKKKGHDESGGVPRGKGDRQIPRKPTPNYFVAVQITNPQIHSGLSQVQQEVMAVNHKMREVMIKLPTLHITLMVINLQTEEDIARASAALSESGSEVRERFKTLPVLEVAGLGTFRNQVVFAKVSPGDALDDLTHIHGCVTDKMAGHGVVSTETRGLTPHITIMKMSMAKPAFRRSVAKKIDLSLYSKFKDMTFGTETVQRLQLCAMLKPKVTSGYYHVAHEVYLGQGEVTLSEFSRSLVQSSIVSAIESVKLDSVKSQTETQVNSQNSKGKLEHKPQKKKHKTKRSKESGNGGSVLKPGKADSTVK